jgi:hypothetical protein
MRHKKRIEKHLELLKKNSKARQNGIEKEWGIKKSSFVASLKSPTN